MNNKLEGLMNNPAINKSIIALSDLRALEEAVLQVVVYDPSLKALAEAVKEKFYSADDRNKTIRGIRLLDLAKKFIAVGLSNKAHDILHLEDKDNLIEVFNYYEIYLQAMCAYQSLSSAHRIGSVGNIFGLPFIGEKFSDKLYRKLRNKRRVK